MKKTIVTLACCALLVPLGFAELASKKGPSQRTTTPDPITVTRAFFTDEGVAASYQPPKTLVIRVDGANNSPRYVLNGPGHVVDEAGEVIRTPIKPGARVRIYYVKVGDSRVIDHVVME